VPPLDLLAGTDTWRVTLALDAARLREFTSLLQEGVAVPVREGTPVLRFLTDQLGIDAQDVAERVTTVFLDGQVVDDLGAALLRDGSSLALSAALPGVGATMRRNGAYAAMRATISRSSETASPPLAAGAVGTVRVKLFNLLIEELGPALLRHGIVLDAGAARDALAFWSDCIGSPAGGAPVFLRVSFVEASRCTST